jgi:tetratricopeptide (TPR) repeat protein
LEIAGQLMGEARSAMESGQNQRAVDALRKLIHELPASPEAHYQLGRALNASGDKAGAVAAFQNALDLYPKYTPAREGLQQGQLTSLMPDDPETVRRFEDYVRKQEYQQLEPLVKDYLKQHPDSWWGYYVLGYAQFGQRRIGDSVASLAKSLQLNLKNAEAHQLLGRDLMAIGRFDAAQTELEQAVKLKPQSAEIRFDLAKIHSANDDYPPAKRELEEAIRLDPSYVEAYEALGFVMEAMSDDGAAVGFYKKAAEMNEARGGTFASPNVDLAAYYNRTGNPELALEYARKSLQINPKSDGGNFQLGKALERTGKLPEAADALNRAIAINPSASSYHYVLSGIYRRLGNLKEAQQQMEVFRKLETDAAEFEQKRRASRREASPAKQ